MPTISMFFGILIAMYFGEDERHHAPHIHVRYGDFKASVSIDSGDILAGHLPPKQLRLTQAWIEIHRESLMVNWSLAQNGEQPFRLPPLQ